MEYNYPKFTPEMKKTHTILIPNMAITQFRLLEYALRYDGYKCEILGNCGSAMRGMDTKAGRRNFITTAAIKYEKNRIKMVRLGKEST